MVVDLRNGLDDNRPTDAVGIITAFKREIKKLLGISGQFVEVLAQTSSLENLKSLLGPYYVHWRRSR